jgi:hypothetical protein
MVANNEATYTMQTERKLLVNPIKESTIDNTPRLPKLALKNHHGPTDSGSSRHRELGIPRSNLNTYDGGQNCTLEDLDFPEIISVDHNSMQGKIHAQEILITAF